MHPKLGKRTKCTCKCRRHLLKWNIEEGVVYSELVLVAEGKILPNNHYVPVSGHENAEAEVEA